MVFWKIFYDYYGIIVDKNGRCFIVVELMKIFIFKGKVKFECFEMIFNFENEDVRVVNYINRKEKEEIVVLVKYIYDESIKYYGFYIYNLFINNCEYFVIFCVIG